MCISLEVGGNSPQGVQTSCRVSNDDKSEDRLAVHWGPPRAIPFTLPNIAAFPIEDAGKFMAAIHAPNEQVSIAIRVVLLMGRVSN